MLSMTISQAKAGFFDRKAVLSAVDRAERKNLSKAGAYIRTSARSSMRKARRKTDGELTAEEKRIFDLRLRIWKQNKDGSPRPKRPMAPSKPGEPPRVVTGLLKKFLFFAYDAGSKSVVIGPARLNSASGTAPATLERGGSATVGGKRRKTVRVAPRPYMGPALAKNKAVAVGLWKDSVK